MKLTVTQCVHNILEILTCAPGSSPAVTGDGGSPQVSVSASSWKAGQSPIHPPGAINKVLGARDAARRTEDRPRSSSDQQATDTSLYIAQENSHLTAEIVNTFPPNPTSNLGMRGPSNVKTNLTGPQGTSSHLLESFSSVPDPHHGTHQPPDPAKWAAKLALRNSDFILDESSYEETQAESIPMASDQVVFEPLPRFSVSAPAQASQDEVVQGLWDMDDDRVGDPNLAPDPPSTRIDPISDVNEQIPIDENFWASFNPGPHQDFPLYGSSQASVGLGSVNTPRSLDLARVDAQLATSADNLNHSPSMMMLVSLA